MSPDDSASQPSIWKLVIDGLDEGRLWILGEAGPVWYGHGTLKPCTVCRLRISASEIQYDLPVPRGTGTVPVHQDCYRMWLSESDKRRRLAT